METKRKNKINENKKTKKIKIPIDYKSNKCIKEKNKKIFQYHVYNQMVESNRRAFRSPVNMKIDFYSTINNPPHIHTLTKNYLDLLSTPLEQKKIKRKNLLFKDDRQDRKSTRLNS